MIPNRRWAYAFAMQAKADLAAYNVLSQNAHLPDSKRLHFLQMAWGKLGKAYQYYRGSVPTDIQTSHAHIAKPIPMAVREAVQRRFKQKIEDALLFEVRLLAREIELLSPDVDGGGTRPDNCEYPWRDRQGAVHIPAEYAFANIDLVQSQAAKLLLKILPYVLEEVIQSS